MYSTQKNVMGPLILTDSKSLRISSAQEMIHAEISH